uniref:Uncharacterized protein n=1 Tax=Anguilla anguilla TaxID=7936 RepID=A0A0E9WQ35_ANGAN
MNDACVSVIVCRGIETLLKWAWRLSGPLYPVSHCDPCYLKTPLFTEPVGVLPARSLAFLRRGVMHPQVVKGS